MSDPSTLATGTTPLDDPEVSDIPMLDHFGLLLGVTTVSVVVQAVVAVDLSASDRGSTISTLAVTLLIGATMVLALRTAGVRRRHRRPAEIVVVVAVVLAITLIVWPGNVSGVGSKAQAPWFWLALSAAAPVMVVRRLLKHQRVGLQTLFGALSALLLLAITFDFAFQVVGDVQSVPFFGQAEPSTSFMYYSLATMTTTGYGDLVAATPLGRLVSVLEAVVGQVYLVTVVALIVSRLATHPARDVDPT